MSNSLTEKEKEIHKKEERDGLVYLWQGYHGEIEVVTFPKLSTLQVRRVAIGAEHSIFCTEGGQVWTCGSNKHGQLGTGSMDYSFDPVFVESLKGECISEVSCGSSHCAVVSQDGKVFCWGASSYSQCGMKSDKVTSPQIVHIQEESYDTCQHGNPLSEREIQIADIGCGTLHTAALSVEGSVWIWGSGIVLGDKNIEETSKPIHMKKFLGKNVLGISCGNFHMLALVEKINTPDDVTLTPRSSRTRSSVLETETHELTPSTCAKCKAEIYSYNDENDTCVISDDHDCHRDKSFDSSITESLNQSQTRTQSNSDDVFKEDLDDRDKISVDKNPEDVKSASVREGTESGKFKNDSMYRNKPAQEENIWVKRSGSFTIENDVETVDMPVNYNEKEETLHTSRIDSDCSGTKESIVDQRNVDKSVSLKIKKIESKNTVSEVGENKSKKEDESAKAPSSHVSDDEESRDIPSVSVEEAETEMEANSKSQITGNKITIGKTSSFSRSRSIVNEKEAREYLLGQLQEDTKPSDDKVKEDDSSKTQSSFGNFLSSMQSYPSSMIQSVATVPYQVTSATSRAISNITDRFSFASGSQGTEKDDKSDSSGLGSNLMLLDFDTSEEDLSNLNSEKSADPGKDMAESSFISAHMPCLDDSSVLEIAGETTLKSKSVRTIEVQQEKLEREFVTRCKTKKIEKRQPVTIETEVWAWGRNSKGQLGVGDEIDRQEPCLLKMLCQRHVVKVSAGGQHSLALTSDSQVYSWGLNASSQLGRSDDTPKPARIQLVHGCYIWDIAAGDSFSIFLMDRAGFQPEVHYVGKHPTKDLYVPIYKTNRLTALTCLKQAGWIRSIAAGGDNCSCLSCWSFTGYTGTLFEVAATERRFFHFLHRILRILIQPLRKSDFFKTLDVFPYKSSMQNLLAAFERITTMVGESATEMGHALRCGHDFLSSSFFTDYESYVEEFKQYLVTFTDIVAIDGLEFITKSGSSFFTKIDKEIIKLLDIEKESKSSFVERLHRLFARPFSHIKEYSRLAEKLACNYSTGSDTQRMLSQVSLCWESLRHRCVTEQSTADNTKSYWETCNFPKLKDALKVPSRRLIRDSKTSPVSLQGAGRMSVHNFLLFSDLFVHAQYSSFKVYSLDTLWVEAPSNEGEKQVIILTMPEEKLTLIVSSSENKVEWLMALNSTINKVLSSQKSVQRHRSTDRLTPPDVRQATHGFLRHGAYKDATYTGYWMNGKMHGFGEMKWTDGRKYIGHFKNSLQHGHGKLLITQDNGKERSMEGYWREGQLHGLAKVRYANGDLYEGHYKDGQRHGHGTYRQGQMTSTEASIYIGQWVMDKKQGYGVIDDIMKGEKYMGMWKDNQRQGCGIIVTLDGMYFEGNFVSDQLVGQGLMLTYDNSCYEGEFNGITQLQGKGKLTMSNGDILEGSFSGSWNEGLKINGIFHKSMPDISERTTSHSLLNKSSVYGTICVPAEKRWEGMFEHCRALLGVRNQQKPDTKKAWENVAVILVKGKKNLLEFQKRSNPRTKKVISLLEDLEKIPHNQQKHLTVEFYQRISQYLSMAFEVPFHPLGKLIEGLVEVFRAAYIGVGAHPRLLDHAVKEIRSYIRRLYTCIRILFPDLPSSGGPQQVFRAEDVSDVSPLESSTKEEDEDEDFEIVSQGSLLHPLLLPKIYPPLFDLYALYNDKEDDMYWERTKKLNKQGDIGLMAYMGIDQKFWLIDESLFRGKGQSISSIKNHFYTSSIEMLQQISTAFSPKEKLEVIQQTFLEITKTMQSSVGETYLCCMDELFPLFQYVVVRAQIRHLGAEIHLIKDLMEPHLENGELGIMFTTLHACYFQIQNEKIPSD